MGLVNKVDKLAEYIELQQKQESRKKSKKFKLPFGVRLGSKSKVRKNNVLVFSISSNGNVDIKFVPIINEMIYLPNHQLYHLASADYMLRYKKYPVIIQPEWSLIPFSPKDHLEKTEKNKEISLPQKVIINAVKLAQLKIKTPLGGKAILWVVIGIVAILYLISKLMGAA